MKEELERDIIDLCPWMFRGYQKSPQESCLAWGFECGDGWYKLLKDLFKKLSKLDKGHIVEITQVKEKYGGLRVYFMTTKFDKDDIYDKVDDIISKYEHKSTKTCEVCGKPGKINKGGWLSCLCDKCKKEHNK